MSIAGITYAPAQLLMELESGDLAASAEESKHQYEQTQSAYQTMTGATVLDDRTKAQSEVQLATDARSG